MNYAGSSSSGGSLSAFMDVNGDNLPDKVYSTENAGVKYIPNLGNLNFHTSALSLTNFSNIGRNTADSDSFGGSASFGIATLGGTYNTSKNVTSTYITDTNGDGLVDLVDNGRVMFNEANSSNFLQNISFSHDNGSTNTQNTIANGSFNFGSTTGPQIRTETIQELQDKNPLHDIVKVWIAPRNGTISITSTASLASQPIPPSLVFPTQGNDQFYTDYDGVRLSVQREWVLLSPALGHLLQPTFTNSNGTPNTASTVIDFQNVPVERGQRIYFRVQANEEGTFDRVSWNPLINYTDTVNPNLQGVNADGISYFNSSAEEGYIVSANSEVIIPANATNISLTWPALNGTFSDDLTFRIEEGSVDANGTPTFPVLPVFVYNQPVLNLANILTINNPGNILTVGKAYRFSVTSNSNVNWRAIDWKPVISMTMQIGTSPAQNSQLYPVVNYGIFNRKVNETTSRVAINPAFPIYIRPEINILPFLTNMPNTTFGTRLIVKNNNGKVILNQLYNIDTNGTGGITPNLNDILLPTANLTNPIFVEYYTDSVAASNFIQTNPTAVRARIGQVVNPITNSIPNIPTTTNSLSIKITGVTIQNIVPTTENFTSAYYSNNTTTNNTPNIFTINPLNPLAIRVNLLTTDHVAVWIDIDRSNTITPNDVFFASTTPNTEHDILINIHQATPVGLYNVRIIGGRNTPYTSAALALTGGFNNLLSTTIRNYQINVVAPVAGNNPVNDVYCRAGNNPFGTMYRNWGQFAYHGGIVIARGVPLFRDTNGEITTANGTGFTMVGNQVGIDTPQERNYPIFPLVITNHGYTTSGDIKIIDIGVIQNAINGTIASGQQSCIDLYNNIPPGNPSAGNQQALADCMSITNESVSNKRFHALSPVNLQSTVDMNITPTPNVPNLWIWQGITDKIRVEPQHLSASRIGVPNINKIFVPIPVDIVNEPLVSTCQFPKIGAVPIIKKGEGWSVATSLGAAGVGFGGNRSYSFNWTELTAMDMNGDRYPDVLTRDNIRYTNGLGSLSFDIGNNLGRVTRDETRSWGATASGTFKRAVTGPGKGFSVGKNAPKPTGKPTSDTSFNIGASWNDDTPLGFFMDINGDGLPDRIDASGGPINVNLNLGYGFGPTQLWLPGYQLLSESTNTGGGFGFTYGANAYGGGVSASSSAAITKSNFMDMNGDGLPDLIFSENHYLLNTGNGFEGQGTVNTAIESISNGESLSITATIPICFLFAQVNVTVSGGGDNNHSFDKNTYQDINGDGYPDILNADTNNTNYPGKFHDIYLSRIGTTNYLKTVHTPTGGSWEVAYDRVGNTFDMPESKFVMSRVEIFDGFTGDNTWSPDRTVTSVQYQNPYHDRREREFFGFETVRVNQHGGYNNRSIVTSPQPTLSAMTLPAVYRYSVQKFHNRNYYLKGAVKTESLYADKDGLPANATTPTGLVDTDISNRDILWTKSSTTYGIYRPGTPLTVADTRPIHPNFTDINYNIGSINPEVVRYGSGVNHTTTNLNFICTDLDHASLFVTPIISVKEFTEGETGLKHAVTIMEEIDAKGNIRQYRDYGEQGADTYVSKIEYNPITINGQSYNGYPSKIQVRNADSSILQRERQALYNDGRGNLTSVITKLNGTQDAEVKMLYDIYGNLDRVTNTNSVNAALLPYFKKYTYDPLLHTFPTRVEDAFGYFSTSEYNYLFGIPVYTTDMNGQPMRTRIDDRGRPIEITGPYELFLEGITGNLDHAWTIRFEYENADNANGCEASVAGQVAGFQPDQFGDTYTDLYNGVVNAVGKMQPNLSNLNNNKHHALTRHFDSEYKDTGNETWTTNQILTATLVDGFGKPIQVKKSAAIFDGVPTPVTVNPAQTVNTDNDNVIKWLLNGKAQTDAFGRAIKSYYPTEQTDTTFSGLNDPTITGLSFIPAQAFVYEDTADTQPPTEATYDVLDRSLTTQLPGESNHTTMEYGINAGRFSTYVTNEKGQIQKSYTDVRGRTLQTVQEAISPITTNFVYNNIGELMTVTDVAGNITESFYDLAGRRTELRHPDNGITKFTYDNASNLTRRETSNLLATTVVPPATTPAIVYTYTFNRLDEIKYPFNPENDVHYYYGTSLNADAANDNAVGRLWYHVDASGTQYFKYGKLGELTKNRRSIAVPGDRVYWFQTDWTYDTWNRVKTISYPDEELVTYKYNRGGELHAMTSQKGGVTGTNIISQLGYDKFGQRTYLRYGNGTETTYSYEADRRRLDRMKVLSNTAFGASGTANRTFIHNQYAYDELSNVISIANNAATVAMPTPTQIGGKSFQSFAYDELNRLVTAHGEVSGRSDDGGGIVHNRYDLTMGYDAQHNITNKNQIHQTATGTGTGGLVATGWTNTQTEQTNYHLDYDGYNTANFTVAGYTYTQPHAPRTIIDQPVAPGSTTAANDPRIKTKGYQYDFNGNQTKTTQTVCNAPGETLVPEILRENLWDEENRLRAIDLNPEATAVHPIAIYTYDAGGERIIKHNATSVAIYENAKKVGSKTVNDFMIYPSGMLVVRPAADSTGTMSYTKHYFAGSQRVSSKIGTTTNLGTFLQDWTLQENTSGGAAINLVGTSQAQLIKAEAGANKVYTAFRMSYTTPHGNPAFVPVAAFTNTGLEVEQYYFHPDHLGSSNYITNIVGEVSQHTEYFAFGETFVEEHKGSNNSPYKFNGKELDNESGLYYYGARYYDPRISIWASVDPLANVDYIMNNEAYVNGEHNGGVYNHFNHNSYSYCYQNPILYVDPNGKQAVAGMLIGAASEYLSIVGTKMIFDGMSFSEANKSLTSTDFINIGVSFVFGGISGLAQYKKFMSSSVGKKFMKDVLLSMIEGFVKIGIKFLREYDGNLSEEEANEMVTDVIGNLIGSAVGGKIKQKLPTPAKKNLDIAKKAMDYYKNPKYIKAIEAKFTHDGATVLNIIGRVINSTFSKTSKKSTTKVVKKICNCQ